MDWRAWHDAYENPDFGLSRRLVLVQEQVLRGQGANPTLDTLIDLTS